MLKLDVSARPDAPVNGRRRGDPEPVLPVLASRQQHLPPASISSPWLSTRCRSARSSVFLNNPFRIGLNEGSGRLARPGRSRRRSRAYFSRLRLPASTRRTPIRSAGKPNELVRRSFCSCRSNPEHQPMVLPRLHSGFRVAKTATPCASPADVWRFWQRRAYQLREARPQ